MEDYGYDTISFVASLSPNKSAISLDGVGEGGQVRLDVPLRDVQALLLLQARFSDTLFRVTINRLEDEE